MTATTAFDALFQQTLWLAGIAFVLMFVTHVLLRVFRVHPLSHAVFHVGAAVLVMAKMGLGASWLLLLVAPAAVFFWALTRGLAALSGLGLGRGRGRGQRIPA
jgi:hypothetical protein